MTIIDALRITLIGHIANLVVFYKVGPIKFFLWFLIMFVRTPLHLAFIFIFGSECRSEYGLSIAHSLYDNLHAPNWARERAARLMRKYDYRIYLGRRQ